MLKIKENVDLKEFAIHHVKTFGWDKTVKFTLDKKDLMNKKEMIKFKDFLIKNYNLDNENYLIDVRQISTNLVPDNGELPKDCLLIHCRFRDKRTEIKVKEEIENE